MPLKVRGPSLPRLSLPAEAFDLLIKSSTLAMLESPLTSNANGLRAMNATGTKSLLVSYGKFLNSKGFVIKAAVVAK